MLDLDAVVHHDIQPGGARQVGGRLVLDVELHPQAAGAHRDRVARDRADVFGLAEAVDDIATLRGQRAGRFGKGGKDALAQYLLAGQRRVDGHDLVAVPDEVFGHLMAGAFWFVGWFG